MEPLKISLSGPPELLAILPYHLGFRPSRSVVVVCFKDKRLGVVVRLDVTPDPVEASRTAESLLPVLAREAPTDVMLIGYEDEVGESALLAEALVVELDKARIGLTDRIVVRGDRWTGLMCSCCPDEPVPQPHEVGAVASYVGLGRAAFDSREDMARTVRPNRPASVDLARSIDEWVTAVIDSGRLMAPLPVVRLSAGPDVTQAELCAAVWAELLSGRLDDCEISDERLCLLLGSLRHRGLRDAIIAVLCPGSLSSDVLDPRLVDLLDLHLLPALAGDDTDGEQGEEVLVPARWRAERRALTASRLERLCRLAPDSHAAPVLALTGTRAWFAGDGVAARMAIERALEVEPAHVLARLLGHLLDRGVRPPGLAA